MNDGMKRVSLFTLLRSKMPCAGSHACSYERRRAAMCLLTSVPCRCLRRYRVFFHLFPSRALWSSSLVDSSSLRSLSPTAVPPSCAASATFARRACLFLCWRPEIAGCFLTNFRALTPHSNHSSVMQTLFSLVNEDLINASTQTPTLTQNTTIQSHIPSTTASQLQAWCTVAKARCAMPAAAPRHCACCIPRDRPLLARIWPAGRERRDGLAQ